MRLKVGKICRWRHTRGMSQKEIKVRTFFITNVYYSKERESQIVSYYYFHSPEEIYTQELTNFIFEVEEVNET